MSEVSWLGAETVSEFEHERLWHLTQMERQARLQGYNCVVGVDEAGRGPLAGPVVAAACFLPEQLFLMGMDDSKVLSATRREELFSLMEQDSRVVFSVGIVEPDVIDQINILQATIQAMLQAVAGLAVASDFLLVDGLQLPHPELPVQKVVKGDRLSQSIAAASVVAKVTRDRMMKDLDAKYPQYGFSKHKGYGTAQHRAALEMHGPCPAHRKSFEPVRSLFMASAH